MSTEWIQNIAELSIYSIGYNLEKVADIINDFVVLNKINKDCAYILVKINFTYKDVGTIPNTTREVMERKLGYTYS